MSGPLDEVKVIDFTSVFSGPYATVLMADFGADVIKVESPAGDSVRGAGPAPTNAMSPPFMALGRNKRSICLDLKQPLSREVLNRLIDGADVLIHNMRAQAAVKLGIDADSARARNARLIHLIITGFGSGGPYSDLPAYDDVVQAASGLVAIQSMFDERPSYVRTAIVDKMASLFALSSICAALVQRNRTNEGCSIEMPMFEAFTSMLLIEHLYGLTFIPPTGPAIYQRVAVPDRRPFKTADGYLSVVLYQGKHWQKFFDSIGQPELSSDPRYSDFRSRTAYSGPLYALVAGEMLKRTNAEWLALLGDFDVPVMPVALSVDDLLNDPHLQSEGFFQESEHPTEGKYLRIPNPLRFSTGLDDDRIQPPVLGQHTIEILEELGYSTNEVSSLVDSRAAVVPEDG